MGLSKGVVLLSILLIVVTGIYLVDLFGFPGSPGSGEVPVLPAVEVREYMGERLDSIGAFRENSIKGPQNVNISAYRLEVKGLVSPPRLYTYDELITRFPHYRKVVTLHCVEGWDVTILWEGILVKDILADSGADPSAAMVIFRAYDGYSTSLSQSYLDDQNILLAYSMNNVTLPAIRGYPFQLVAEDRWGYKWIKWVTSMEVSNDQNFRGYWESRGYSNLGYLNRSFFGL
ncbi:DMSO/TMAO reductase YedYZ molybdopterin-dependent catalytic subunit [Methanolinea mesophila]|uniref:molybdopterin-dependent oxidoreductase n=1 Tax=Methanolinea mesophila TaxID=547055 RepID=UPI001AE5365F|nr:molybdopterin-dependent oxidoreductase [Methanolinea mesophila]MBP1928502.1 DMSO/TMAO reductase YedYZ molybdopterin-dependent catalytic subunit [Methanolinea mesophila]